MLAGVPYVGPMLLLFRRQIMAAQTQNLNQLRYLRDKLLTVVHMVGMYHSFSRDMEQHGWRWRTSPLQCETWVHSQNYSFSISVLNKASPYILCTILLGNK